MLDRARSGGTLSAVGAAVALCALALPATSAAGPTDWLKLRTLNIAHQGAEDEAPSNTMYAYERALRLGADMLEVDIHTTEDNKLVVLHDSTVDRTTNGSGSVYEMTLKEIQALDAGHNMVPGEGTEQDAPRSDYPFRGVRLGERKPPPGFTRRDFRIPSLAEVMRTYPMAPINIEIKGESDGNVASFLRNAEKLARFLNRIGRSRGIIVASFNDAALARFHELAPQIDTAPATGAVAAYKLGGIQPPEGTVAFQVPTEFQGVTVVDEDFVEQAHSDGYAVHVWTINDPPTMRQLLDWRADGIMTAESARLERVLCNTDTARPDRHRSLPGRHCNRRASIACDVAVTKVKRKGRRATLSLRRRDDFDSRCAGRITLKAIGRRARRSTRFNFTWLPPSRGGPVAQRETIRLNRKLRRSIRRQGAVRAIVHPYTAFAEKRRVAVG